jgi:Domain of unknown function (DUF5666)
MHAPKVALALLTPVGPPVMIRAIPRMVNMRRALIRFFPAFAGLVMIVGCSQGASQLSPAGPSAALPASGGHPGAWTTSGAPGGWTASIATLGAAQSGKKKASGVGTVASLTGDCEDSLSMVVQGVRIVTDDETLFYIDPTEQIEGGCGNLRAGTKVKVEVEADANPDGSYTADSITIIDQPGGPPPVSVEGDGTVAALKGTCPTLTMVVRGYPVMTTSSTTFSGGDCEDLAAGTRVHVEGVLAANSVVADSVEILPPQ